MNFTNYQKFYEEGKYETVISEKDYLGYKDITCFIN